MSLRENVGAAWKEIRAEPMSRVDFPLTMIIADLFEPKKDK